jgi:tRNA pseudouridine55 synthase
MINKKTNEIEDVDFKTGEVILIDKYSGWTSFDVVNKIRKITHTKKVGHAGTLDPAATGLLIVCTGKKTKEIYKYQEAEKTYSGVIRLGEVTDTFDAEGKILETRKVENISETEILKVRDSFLGEIKQTPPMYSAKKHKGKALYKYARKGVEVEREPRTVRVYSFDILNVSLPEIEFRIKCSKGTYIRVIAYDFGKKLGTGAHLKELRREAIGGYSVEDALTIDEFAEIFYTEKITVN